MKTKNSIFTEYLDKYLASNKEEKGKILDHICFITKMHRNAAIRKFRAIQLKDPCKEEKRGRDVFYTPDVILALEEIWKISGEICGELLYPIIKEFVGILIRDGMWKHENETTEKLLVMGKITVRRKISGFKKIRSNKKGMSATKPSKLKMIIPIFTGPWKDKSPGHGQIDTVIHCSDTLLGDYIYTLNYTDAALLWTRHRGQWNKGQTATVRSMEYIRSKLPFDLFEIHPDTGSEFINWFMYDWSKENKIEITRSRPGHKNDNMYVEERNGHIVRKFVGYQKLNCMEVVDVLNELYDVLDLYLNHFIPVKRCLKKERVGSKWKKYYEKTAKTPYQRLLEHPSISNEIKAKIKIEHIKLNPLILHKEVERLRKKVYDTQKRCENL